MSLSLTRQNINSLQIYFNCRFSLFTYVGICLALPESGPNSFRARLSKQGNESEKLA